MDIVQHPALKSGNKTVLSEEKLSSWVLKRARSVYVPSSVYRLQLNRMFTFRDAAALVPYLKALGIEAVYCSPYFQAVPGSMHGYNVADPTRINAELGSTEDYSRFCEVLAAHDLGHIVDVVPNHMGISGNANQWWLDVLENGQASVYAGYFDIDWDSAKNELKGKVLLPVLGDFYGKVLEGQELQLVYEDGSFRVTYYERSFPVDPQTYPVILESGLAGLEKQLPEASADFQEYLSVITAFRNLPSRGDARPESVAEREREKEISKRRLGAVARRCAPLRDFILGRVAVFNGVKGVPGSFDLMDQLLNQQVYRLGLWSVAVQEINYRRFFNVNDLAALRIEDPRVFQHYHRFLFTLIREGKVNGLRIDHPDGLYDPPAYFRALQRECLLQLILQEWDRNQVSGAEQAAPVDVDAARRVLDELLTRDFRSSPGFLVVAEKILDRDEQIPDDWNIHGTVGYDFMNAVNGLFVDGRNEAKFSSLYERYIGHRIDFADLVYAKKKFFGLVHMASEINALGNRLDLISETNRNFRDFTRNDLTLAIREVIACFPVYRTYVSPDAATPSVKDVQYITQAVDRAKARTPALNPAVFDFLRDVLLLRISHDVAGEEGRLYRDFLLRFQQLTGPIMAKGVEDTSFYVFNRLISLNEVGGDPFHFGNSVPSFHRQNASRGKRWPCSFLASSTHDTKRSEDVRMRINVLSEIPDEWNARIEEWGALNLPFKKEIGGAMEPRRNTEYYIYQTLIGVWPDRLIPDTEFPAFRERIWQVALKSVREAKIYTSWIRPDLEYEGAVQSFVYAVLSPGPENRFLESFLAFQRRVAFFGKLNALSAMLLKVCSPGVVDHYQGDELWNYCLVDPDNRGPVDFERRRAVLAAIDCDSASGGDVGALVELWGRQDPDKIKLFFLSRYLRARRLHKELFLGSDYYPVAVLGPRGENLVAFLRVCGNKVALAVATRFFTGLTAPENGYAPPSGLWQGTRLMLPEGVACPDTLTEAATGHQIRVQADKQGARFVRAEDVLRHSYTGLYV